MWESVVAFFGIKLPSIIAAFIGSLLSLRFINSSTFLGRLAIVAGGFIGAVTGTPLILHLGEFPIVFEAFTAVLLSMFGMSLFDAIHRAIAAADLWSIVRGWLERRG